MKVIGYVRVSTDRQAEREGPDVQRKAIRAWAKANGHRPTFITDNGVSGTVEAGDRPGLAEALLAIKSNRAKGLVVHRLDRLARLLTVQEAILAQVWGNGGKVFTVDGGEVLQDDPDDPMRTAMRQMAGVFGQLERGMMSARLRAGRRNKADRGGFAYGSPPYGYETHNRELVPVPAEQAAIKRAVALRASGLGYLRIAQQLTADGHKPRKGAVWYPAVVSRMLQRAQEQKPAPTHMPSPLHTPAPLHKRNAHRGRLKTTENKPYDPETPPLQPRKELKRGSHSDDSQGR